MTTSIENSLQGVTRLFLDTAPVVYYVERNPTYRKTKVKAPVF